MRLTVAGAEQCSALRGLSTNRISRETWVDSFNNPSYGAGYELITNIYSSSNDFRVNFLGDSNVSPREAILWSSEVQFFHDVNDWRKRFFNDDFIDELNLPAAVSESLNQKQFRSDLIIYNFNGSHDTVFPRRSA